MMQEDDWWTESIAGFDVAVGRPDTLCGWVVGQAALHMETLTEEQVYDIRFNDDGNDGDCNVSKSTRPAQRSRYMMVKYMT